MFRSLLLGVALGAPNALNEANDLRSIMERGMSNAGKEQTAKETAVAAPRLSVVDMEKQQEKQRADVEAELAEAQKMKDMFRQGGEEGAGGGQRRGEGAPGCSFLREHEAGNLRQALRERRP